MWKYFWIQGFYVKGQTRAKHWPPSLSHTLPSPPLPPSSPLLPRTTFLTCAGTVLRTFLHEPV